MTKTTSQTLTIAQVRAATDARYRRSIDHATVDRYAEAYRAGEELPPIVLFRDAAGDLYFADGGHRLDAAEMMGAGKVRCVIHDVDDDMDIRQYAAAANAAHGRPRDADELHSAIDDFMARHPDWTDVQIADTCRCHRTTVARRRSPAAEAYVPPTDTRVATDTSSGTRDIGASRPDAAPHKAPPPPPPTKDDEDQPGDVALALRKKPWFAETANEITRLKTAITNASQEPWGRGLLIDLPELQHDLNDLRSRINGQSPRSICLYCSGTGLHGREACGGCEGSGWMTVAAYNQAPSDMKGD